MENTFSCQKNIQNFCEFFFYKSSRIFSYILTCYLCIHKHMYEYISSKSEGMKKLVKLIKINNLGRIHLPLTDIPSVKCV